MCGKLPSEKSNIQIFMLPSPECIFIFYKQEKETRQKERERKKERPRASRMKI